MDALTKLPVEILQMIASQANGLSKSDLASLALTNRQLCAAISPVLYKTFGVPRAIDFAFNKDRADILQAAIDWEAAKINDASLLRACQWGAKNIVTWILDNIPQIIRENISRCEHGHYAESKWTSPLCAAIDRGHEKVALILLSRGACPRITIRMHSIGPISPGISRKSIHCDTALHLAAEAGMKQVVQFLIQKRILSVNEKGEDGRTPLHASIIAGRMSHGRSKGTFKQLIDLGADIEAEDNAHHRPLLCAIENHEYSFALRLLDAGAKAEPNTADHGVRRPITAAAEDCYLGYSYNMRYRGRSYEFPKEAQCLLVSKLVESGADINVVDCDGRTPLTIASRLGTDQLLSRMISLGADVNRQDGHGDKPFNRHLSHRWAYLQWGRIEQTFWEMVEIYLKAGAEFDEDKIWINREERYPDSPRLKLRRLIMKVQ